MYVVVPLAAKALQHKLAVYARLLAQLVAGKTVAHPLGLVSLHPQLHPHVTFLVHLVKVLLTLRIGRGLLDFIHQISLFYVHADVGVRNLGDKHLYGMAHPEEVRQGEYHHVGAEQHWRVIKCRVEIQHHRQDKDGGICYERKRKGGLVCQAAWQYYDIDHIENPEEQGHQPQYQVKRKNVLEQFVGRIDFGKLSRRENGNDIYHSQHENRSRVSKHSPPLEETGHHQTQGIYALQIGTYHQHKQHVGVQQTRATVGHAFSKHGHYGNDYKEYGQNPRQTQVLNPMTSQNSRQEHPHEMRRCTTGKHYGYYDGIHTHKRKSTQKKRNCQALALR